LSVVYVLLTMMAFAAGTGTLAVVLLLRPPRGTRANDQARLRRPAPAAAAEPTEPPRTVHHGFDTMDVLAAGWEAAQEQLGAGFTMRACNAAPAGASAPAEWRCVKPAGHLYLHETATGGAWGDSTFEPPQPGEAADPEELAWHGNEVGPGVFADQGGWVSGPCLDPLPPQPAGEHPEAAPR